MAKAKIKAKLPRPSKAILQKLYIKEGKSILGISKKLKVSEYSVRCLLKKNKISLRKGPRDKNWDKYIELTIILQSQDGGNSWGIKSLKHDWNWRKPDGFVEALFWPEKKSKAKHKKNMETF